MTSAHFRFRYWLAVLALGVLGLAGACATKTINDVLADPSRYRNQEVTLSGSVIDSYSLGERGAYQLSDGRARLWVVSTHGVPRTGARVEVRGRIREGFNLGSLGGAIRLPAGVGQGLVLVETEHRAK